MRVFSAHRLFDGVIIALCSIAYGHALFSVAIGGFWHGPDFDHPPMTGLDCLLTGWLHYPLGWLANLALVAGIVLFLVGFRLLACLFGLFALGMACIFAKEFARDFPADLLKQGYHSWLMSMQIFVVGSACSLVLRYCIRPTSRSSGRRQGSIT